MTSFTLSHLPGPDTKQKEEAYRYSHGDVIFRHMLAEAARTGMPTGFQNDFYVHDMQTRMDNPEETDWVWILRRSGTYFYPTTCENKNDLLYVRSVVDYWVGDHKLNVMSAHELPYFYHVSEDGARRITPQEAHDLFKLKTKNETLANILRYEYGVTILEADPTTILWACERIEDAAHALCELQNANNERSRLGVRCAYPEYGSRLFKAAALNREKNNV